MLYPTHGFVARWVLNKNNHLLEASGNLFRRQLSGSSTAGKEPFSRHICNERNYVWTSRALQAGSRRCRRHDLPIHAHADGAEITSVPFDYDQQGWWWQNDPFTVVVRR